MVTFQVLGSILSFAIGCLMEFLHDRRASRFRSFEVCVSILDENRQRLGPDTDFRRGCTAWTHAPEHYPGIAKMHLRTLDWSTRFAISESVHGLLKKIGHTYKYYLTRFGKDVITTGLKLRELVIIPQPALSSTV